MISRVVISKQLLASFRKRTLEAYPNETMQTLWGRVEGDTVVISGLRTPEQKATQNELVYYDSDTVGPQSAIRGEHYLGTVHSHPDSFDATPSQQDWDTSYSSGERIFGIMCCKRQVSGRFKTEVKFWEPRPDIAIVNPRVRAVGTSSGFTSVQSAAADTLTKHVEPAPSQSIPRSGTTLNTSTTGVMPYDRDNESKTKPAPVQEL